MSREYCLSYLRHELSIAKTRNDPARLGVAIYAAQFAANPSGEMHTLYDVDIKMESLIHSQYTDREDMELVLSFLEKGCMTPQHCERLSGILIHKHSFVLPTPLDQHTLALLENDSWLLYLIIN